MTEEDKRKTVNISKRAHKKAFDIVVKTDKAFSIGEVVEMLIDGYSEKEIIKLAKEKDTDK